MRVWLTDLLGVLSCALLLVFSGLKWIKYFDNSVTKIYTSQEDYKPVIFCVHYCQIPIYTAALLVSCQLQIIITLLYIESMPVYFMIQYQIQFMLRTGLRFTPRYYQAGAGFIPRQASHWQHRRANLWVVSTARYLLCLVGCYFYFFERGFTFSLRAF